jgi:hypothetical protein
VRQLSLQARAAQSSRSGNAVDISRPTTSDDFNYKLTKQNKKHKQNYRNSGQSIATKQPKTTLDKMSAPAPNGAATTAAPAANDARDPSGFLSEIIGAPVTVKLNSGVVYKGKTERF